MLKKTPATSRKVIDRARILREAEGRGYQHRM
jgi:hypothetical protein